MFKVFAYLKKRDDLTAEEFRDYYENNHVPLVLSFAPMPNVYKRNYLIRGDDHNREDSSIDFDVITELVWEDRSGSEEWRRLLGRAEIGTDEEKFIDRPRTRAYIVEERVSAPIER
jgi:hypothetical protein